MNAPLSKIDVLRHALAGPLNALTRHKQFILCRFDHKEDGRRDKVPVSATTFQPASAHDSVNWLDHETACAFASSLGTGYGVGFVLTANTNLWCLDIDGALQADNTWSPIASELCTRLTGAAVEISVSGRGLHLWGNGPVPAHASKNTQHHIELYTEGRFIALSGTNASGNASTSHDAAIADVVRDYFPPRVADTTPTEWTESPCEGWGGEADDDALIEHALAHVRPVSAAEAFGDAVRASFRDLWERNEAVLSQTWPADGRPFDASSADFALACELAYWTGKNCARIERLLVRSALNREKWVRHGTYLRDTITRACAGQQRFVGDRAVPVDGCVPHSFIIADGGVSYAGDDGDPIWICSPLRVTALARDKASNEWGRVLEWSDADKSPHQWVMPMEMLKGDGADMRGELLRLGLQIAPGNKARNKLTEYITIARPSERAQCVTRTGWHDDVFVFPIAQSGRPSNACCSSPRPPAALTRRQARWKVGRTLLPASALVTADCCWRYRPRLPACCFICPVRNRADCILSATVPRARQPHCVPRAACSAVRTIYNAGEPLRTAWKDWPHCTTIRYLCSMKWHRLIRAKPAKLPTCSPTAVASNAQRGAAWRVTVSHGDCCSCRLVRLDCRNTWANPESVCVLGRKCALLTYRPTPARGTAYSRRYTAWKTVRNCRSASSPEPSSITVRPLWRFLKTRHA